MDENGKVKIGNFGLSQVKKLLVENLPSSRYVPFHFAPEVLEGRPYTEKADLYSYSIPHLSSCNLLSGPITKHVFNMQIWGVAVAIVHKQGAIVAAGHYLGGPSNGSRTRAAFGAA
jgi:hypothetical protein